MAAKKTYRTRCEVHRTVEPGKPGDRAKGVAPTPPKVKILAPKTRLNLDPEADETQELLALGAIELATDEKKAEEETLEETTDSDEALAALDEEYKETFGKAAPKNMKPETKRKKIDEKKAEDAASDDDDEGDDDDLV